VRPVRQAAETDLPGIVRVYLRAYAQPPWNEQNDPEKTAGYVRWLMTPPHMRTLVAWDENGELAGFAISSPRPYEHFVADWDHMGEKPLEGWPLVEGQLGYIWELAVDPDRQRRGLGSALMAATLEGLRGDGVQKVILRSSERADAAMALYKKFDFQRLPVKEKVDPLAGPWLLDLSATEPA
jgi:ribosomal protein S18 acetylase RimI-like enzyme